MVSFRGKLNTGGTTITVHHKAVTAGDRVALSPDPKHATSRFKNAKRSTYELEPGTLQDVASEASLETGIS